MADPKLLSATQIAAHNSPRDCWIVVAGQVWDLSEFAPEHPGGAGGKFLPHTPLAVPDRPLRIRRKTDEPGTVILKYAGRDATEAYSQVHGSLLLSQTLTSSKLRGTLDPNTPWSEPPPSSSGNAHPPRLDGKKPPLFSLLSSHDFESVAAKTLTPKTWAFYSSAATDLITARANKSFFDRMWFRPRVLRDVRRVNTRCEVLGVASELPLFVSPAAMARMVHPSGERGIAAACAGKGIVQCVSGTVTLRVRVTPCSGDGGGFVGIFPVQSTDSTVMTGIYQRLLFY